MVESPSRETPPDPHLAEVLDGRYRIDALIGTGGIGAVYRGTHLGLGKPVAIKLLRPEFAQNPELLARFDREARALSRLSHVSIVSVTDFGVANGFPYLVMELLEGTSLEDEIDAGRVDLERGLTIGRQILATLEYAHGQGVVHRDLKPQNVMLIDQPGMRDLVKILDFGLAKIVTEEPAAPGERSDPTLTRHGTIFGTPAYMSPEQAAGDAADARSDLYSAGVLLFELLAGRVPFLSDTPAELIRHHITTRPPRMSDVAPDRGISESLERVIARALHKDRGGRHQTAGELLEALAEAIALGARASSPSSSQETKKYPSLVGARATGTDKTIPATPAVVAGARLVRSRSRGIAIGAFALLVLVAIAVGSRLATTDAGPRGVQPAVRGSAGPRGPAGRKDRAKAPGPTPVAGPAAGRRPARDPWRGGDVPSELARALLLVDNDEFDESEGYAKLWVKAHRGDPRAHLVLGHGYCGRGWRRDGLWRYKLALRIDESVRGDPRLLPNLVIAVGDERVARDADQMIRTFYGEEATPALLAATLASRTLSGAHRAVRILEDLGRGGEIDRVGVALADLTRARRCRDRQVPLAVVRAAKSDPRVGPALEALGRDAAVAQCLGELLGE